MGIYPNPASTQISFNIDASNTLLKAVISDISGRSVLNNTFSRKAASEYFLDISDLLPGMYMVQLQTDKGIATGKFIKK